jgi:hypothetical protein
MANSHFVDIMKSYLKEKNIELTSFGWQRIRDIERALNKGELEKKDVASKLSLDTTLRLGLDRNDYRKIEDQLKRKGL